LCDLISKAIRRIEIIAVPIIIAIVVESKPNNNVFSFSLTLILPEIPV
jgi:hypothetical protein